MGTLKRREFVAASAAWMAAPVLAQPKAWAQRPVRWVVPFPPAGLMDSMARLLAPELESVLGQPLVIENKPGAGGNVGAAEVSRAAADGYTWLMASPALTISAALYKTLPYRLEQLRMAAILGRVPNVLLVNAKSSVTSVQALNERLRQQPNALNYASNGNGTSLHLSAELYKSQTGVSVKHIPYRGSGAALTALMAGEVDMMFDNLPSALAHIQSGRVKALAVTTAQRSPTLPDVPTLQESGVPNFDISAWMGVALPAGVPAHTQQAIEQALEHIFQKAQVQASMKKLGVEPAFLNSERARVAVEQEIAVWKKVVETAHITPET